MTMLDLGPIKARAKAAPIVAYTCDRCGAVNRLTTDVGRDSHEDIPALVAEVEKLREALAGHHGLRGTCALLRCAALAGKEADGE